MLQKYIKSNNNNEIDNKDTKYVQIIKRINKLFSKHPPPCHHHLFLLLPSIIVEKKN